MSREWRLRIVRDGERREKQPVASWTRRSRSIAEQLHRAAKRRADAELAYVTAIEAAHEAGWSTRKIGRAMGVSHTHVGQLVREARELRERSERE